jgi:hypothetical protein
VKKQNAFRKFLVFLALAKKNKTGTYRNLKKSNVTLIVPYIDISEDGTSDIGITPGLRKRV